MNTTQMLNRIDNIYIHAMLYMPPPPPLLRFRGYAAAIAAARLRQRCHGCQRRCCALRCQRHAAAAAVAMLRFDTLRCHALLMPLLHDMLRYAFAVAAALLCHSIRLRLIDTRRYAIDACRATAFADTRL